MSMLHLRRKNVGLFVDGFLKDGNLERAFKRRRWKFDIYSVALLSVIFITREINTITAISNSQSWRFIV